MNEILTGALRDILYVVIIAVIVLMARYGLPWLGKFIKIRIIDKLVAAAEQKIKGSGMGTEKKAEVIAQLEALHIKVDDFIDNMIEAAVYALNTKKAEIEQNKPRE